jgi:class 3 adenylate cyclase
MAGAGISSTGLDAFIERYCGNAELLKQKLADQPRLIRCQEGEALCYRDETADCVWIVETGTFAISHTHSITERRRAELIGEAAFYRIEPDGTKPRRAADVIARSRASAWRIDRAILDNLPDGLRLAWTEGVARALVAKLDEATTQRAALTDDAGSIENLAKRFVCEEGLAAALAMHRTGSAEIRAHRTQAVVWFSDVAGFSAYAKDLSPSEIGAILRRVMEIQCREIRAAGGHVDKFMGDGLMAFWLCPDEPRLGAMVGKAAQAAVAAGRRVREIIEQEGWPIDIRIGLHFGDVSIGDFGGDDRIAFTLVGDAVNIAARYEQCPVPPNGPRGVVRISDILFARLGDERGLFLSEPILLTDKHARTYAAHLSSF